MKVTLEKEVWVSSRCACGPFMAAVNGRLLCSESLFGAFFCWWSRSDNMCMSHSECVTSWSDRNSPYGINFHGSAQMQCCVFPVGHSFRCCVIFGEEKKKKNRQAHRLRLNAQMKTVNRVLRKFSAVSLLQRGEREGNIRQFLLLLFPLRKQLWSSLVWTLLREEPSLLHGGRGDGRMHLQSLSTSQCFLPRRPSWGCWTTMKWLVWGGDLKHA